MAVELTKEMLEFAKKIDSTMLHVTVTEPELRDLCEKARDYQFATISVPHHWMTLAAELLAGSGVGITAGAGYPLGFSTLETKVFEAVDSVRKGATEVDMTMAIGPFKSGKYQLVEDEIRAVVEAIPGTLVKVIIETHFLTDDEKKRAAELCVKGGAQYVKTSTGYTPTGATVEDIRLLYAAVGDQIKVKGSGGIRTTAFALELLDAGASRLGASKAHLLVEGLRP